MPEEAQIIRKCKKNNARAQRELYEMYKVKWFMICLRYAQDKSEAEDMLQEGLINVFKEIKQYNPDKASFAAWSNKVMVNAALQFLRKWRRLKFNQDIEQYDTQLIQQEDVFGKIGAKELNAMIQKLPAGYRTVFNQKTRIRKTVVRTSESFRRSNRTKAERSKKYQKENRLTG